MSAHPYLRRHIAITNEHGSWVFLLSPLIIGLTAGGGFSFSSVYLILAALAGFLLRQPVSIAIKVYSDRRPRTDLPAARFWIMIYGVIGAAMSICLALSGFAFILYLAIPGLPVFIWHLFLVSKRAERRQMGIELVASGVLALTAPAAYWVGVGNPDPFGLWLWGLTWLQSAASIVYVYLRLEQRTWKKFPPYKVRFNSGRRALLYTGFNLCLVLGLAILDLVPTWLPLPYGLQFFETLWGSLIRPAMGLKPSTIGYRQLAVSILFTVLFIITWRLT